MEIRPFLNEVIKIHKTGKAGEHSYRPAIKGLVESFSPKMKTNKIMVINEPKAVACGAPDFSVHYGKDEITIGHIEAKDIGVDIHNLKGKNEEQLERYRKALPNLVYTNCLDWNFYKDGKLVEQVSIGKPIMGIQAEQAEFSRLQMLLRDFVESRPISITTPDELAKRMAGKARLVKEILKNILRSDEKSDERSELIDHYIAFKENLIQDISIEQFSDIYAETIAYGMFAARLHDDTPETFSRQEALDLLPKSNPFLRKFFTYISGQDLDERIRRIIDDLVSIFLAANVKNLMERYGKVYGKDDPFLHFYEDFLRHYNPEKRKARGVWYTPIEVVRFIVRAVDEVLQKEFNISKGLADNRKITINWDSGQNNKKIKKEVHKVQILDPATGTGTFLAEAINQIAPKIQKTAKGQWGGYVVEDLIPRLHGFELLMASYTMCHTKLDMVLTNLGYKPPSNPKRMRVYLTDSLEEGKPADQTLPFARWLSKEAKGANKIKHDMPIMCVIGNPPYSGESQNKSDWIMKLMEAYKKEPGGKEKLKERNPKWINDDYVKFIRLAEHYIDKNGEGVLGFITAHGYLDNPTFRGMRWHLRKTFDKIYVLDLHGNAKRKEVCPDGSPDKNVFDIQQGVAILIAVKKKDSKGRQADVYHSGLWGKREVKQEALEQKTLHDKDWKKLSPNKPFYFFIPRNDKLEGQYQQGFSIKEFMPENSVGIATARDGFCIDYKKKVIEARLKDLRTETDIEVLRNKYHLRKDVRDWSVAGAKKDVEQNFQTGKLTKLAYRPFDTRWTFYTGNSKGFHCMPRGAIMRHMLEGENLAMLISRSAAGEKNWKEVQCTNKIVEFGIMSTRPGNATPLFPLYLYDEVDGSKRVNFDKKIYAKIQKKGADKKHGTPDEMAVFDYIYGVLHCPDYRQIYKDFLKSDFPHIPYPSSAKEFWEIADKGGQLRSLHLMEEKAIGETPYPFEGEGSSKVVKIQYKNEQVWINDTQFFAKVPEMAWEFYIGGYQPVQKWLKARKGQKLSFNDICHYQKIIKILVETDRIMKTIKITP